MSSNRSQTWLISVMLLSSEWRSVPEQNPVVRDQWQGDTRTSQTFSMHAQTHRNVKFIWTMAPCIIGKDVFVSKRSERTVVASKISSPPEPPPLGSRIPAKTLARSYPQPWKASWSDISHAIGCIVALRRSFFPLEFLPEDLGDDEGVQSWLVFNCEEMREGSQLPLAFPGRMAIEFEKPVRMGLKPLCRKQACTGR